MKKVFGPLLLVAAIVIHMARPAMADGPGVSLEYDVLIGGSAFTTQALDSSKTTDAITVRGLTFLDFTLQYVYNSATDVRMACQKSHNGTVWSDKQVLESVSVAGVINSEDAVWKKDVTASKTWSWSVSILGEVYLRCTFSATGGAASDTVTVTARGGGLQ